MDPDVTLRELVDILEGKRSGNVQRHLIDLQAWIRQGGWAPTLTYHQWTGLLDVLIDLAPPPKGGYLDPRGE